MFFSTLFALFGLGALCWILINLAVYALPFAIGLTSGMYLYETGSCPSPVKLGHYSGHRKGDFAWRGSDIRTKTS